MEPLDLVSGATPTSSQLEAVEMEARDDIATQQQQQQRLLQALAAAESRAREAEMRVALLQEEVSITRPPRHSWLHRLDAVVERARSAISPTVEDELFRTEMFTSSYRLFFALVSGQTTLFLLTATHGEDQMSKMMPPYIAFNVIGLSLRSYCHGFADQRQAARIFGKSMSLMWFLFVFYNIQILRTYPMKTDAASAKWATVLLAIGSVYVRCCRFPVLYHFLVQATTFVGICASPVWSVLGRTDEILLSTGAMALGEMISYSFELIFRRSYATARQVQQMPKAADPLSPSQPDQTDQQAADSPTADMGHERGAPTSRRIAFSLPARGHISVAPAPDVIVPTPAILVADVAAYSTPFSVPSEPAASLTPFSVPAVPAKAVAVQPVESGGAESEHIAKMNPFSSRSSNRSSSSSSSNNNSHGDSPVQTRAAAVPSPVSIAPVADGMLVVAGNDHTWDDPVSDKRHAVFNALKLDNAETTTQTNTEQHSSVAAWTAASCADVTGSTPCLPSVLYGLCTWDSPSRTELHSRLATRYTAAAVVISSLFTSYNVLAVQGAINIGDDILDLTGMLAVFVFSFVVFAGLFPTDESLRTSGRFVLTVATNVNLVGLCYTVVTEWRALPPHNSVLSELVHATALVGFVLVAGLFAWLMASGLNSWRRMFILIAFDGALYVTTVGVLNALGPPPPGMFMCYPPGSLSLPVAALRALFMMVVLPFLFSEASRLKIARLVDLTFRARPMSATVAARLGVRGAEVPSPVGPRGLTIATPDARLIVEAPVVHPDELPVRPLRLWCRDDALEHALCVRMYRDNFELHMATSVVPIAVAVTCIHFLPMLCLLGPVWESVAFYTAILAVRWRTHMLSDHERGQRLGTMLLQSIWVIKGLSLCSYVVGPTPFLAGLDYLIFSPASKSNSQCGGWADGLNAAVKSAPLLSMLCPFCECVKAEVPHKELPAFIPVCAAIDVFVGCLQLLMLSASSSALAMARRLGILLVVAIAEIAWLHRMTSAESIVLPVAALLIGLGIGYFFERTQRTNLLTVLRLADQVKHTTRWAAKAEEKNLVRRIFAGPELPSLVLQARVDLGDLQLQHTIGAGSFGSVYFGLWHGQSSKGPCPVAVKTLHRVRIGEQCLRSTVAAAELELSLPPHHNIVGLLGVAWSIDSARVVLISEYCAGGSMARALKCGATKEWPMTSKMSIIAGIAAGLAYLHDQRVVHGDLKPDHVLFADAECNHPKIADFGETLIVSSAASSERDATLRLRTLLFAAPEHARPCSLCRDGSGVAETPRHEHEKPLDVWAFGCVLVCLFTDHVSPYPRDTSDQGAAALIADIGAGRRLPVLDEPHPMHGFVRDCCCFVAEQRPTAEDLAKQLAAAESRLKARLKARPRVSGEGSFSSGSVSSGSGSSSRSRPTNRPTVL